LSALWLYFEATKIISMAAFTRIFTNRDLAATFYAVFGLAPNFLQSTRYPAGETIYPI